MAAYGAFSPLSAPRRKANTGRCLTSNTMKTDSQMWKCSFFFQILVSQREYKIAKNFSLPHSFFYNWHSDNKLTTIIRTYNTTTGERWCTIKLWETRKINYQLSTNSCSSLPSFKENALKKYENLQRNSINKVHLNTLLQTAINFSFDRPVEQLAPRIDVLPIQNLKPQPKIAPGSQNTEV